MCTITKQDNNDTPTLKCESCGVLFGIWWHGNGFTTGIEFCPFCGDEVEDFVDDTEDE